MVPLNLLIILPHFLLTNCDISSLTEGPAKSPKSFLPLPHLTSLSISLNPYDPITRVPGTELWRKIFNFPQQDKDKIEPYFDASTSTTSLYSILNPIHSIKLKTGPPNLTSLASLTSLHQKKPFPPLTPSTTTYSPITTVAPPVTSAPVTSTPTNSTLSTTPTAAQLLNCIDWLLDWLQGNSSSPLMIRNNLSRNKGLLKGAKVKSHRNRDREFENLFSN